MNKTIQSHSQNIKIQVSQLAKEFIIHSRGSIKIRAYHNINFTVHKGEFLSLYGPSGAGKSSILKALFRTYTTTNGDIHFYCEDGTTINLASCDESTVLQVRKKELGYVSQFLRVLPRISAVDIVSAPLIEKGSSQSFANEKAKNLLDYFGIKEELFSVSPLTFSGGEQQRVNIAKGIIAPKSVLLLDEPTASLDHANTIKTIDKLKAIKKTGVAMVGIFHDVKAMSAISDQVYNIG